MFLSAILIQTGYDLIPIDFAGIPLNILEDRAFLRVKAWMNRGEDGTVLSNGADVGGERSSVADSLQIFYQADNVFTQEHLQTISDFETKILSVANFGKYCKADSRSPTNNCSKPLSILRFFDGTFGPTFNDPTFSDIVGKLSAAQNSPKLNEVLQFYLGKEAVINSTTATAKSSITRSMIQFGYPLAGYDEQTGDVDEQQKKVQTFLVENVRDLLIDANENGLSGLTVTYTSGQLFSYLIQSQVIKDLMLAAGSFLFIFIFMLIQTQSLFITSCAVGGILISFLGTNLVYRIILDYQYFGIFHVLSIFIVLGIGADDVFVFNDTWRATAHEKHERLDERLSSCYRRASKAMLITSLTTTIAFIANAFNPMLAISSFGIFSGILVMVNYLSAITFFPCVVIIYHLYFENWTWPCFRCCKKKVEPTNLTDAEKFDGHRKNLIVRFFRGPYYYFVVHKVARWVLLVLSLGLIVFFVYMATTIGPQEEQIQFLKDSNNFQKATNLNLQGFRPSSDDNVIKVYIVWGLKHQDLSACHKTDSKCKGKTVWDDGFDLNPKPAQMSLLQLCKRIEDMTDEENGDLKIRRNSITGKLEVKCFLDRINDFLINEGNDTSLYSPTVDLSLPTSETKMATFMGAHPELYNMSAVSPNFYRYFETGMSYWLNNGYSGVTSYDFREYNKLIGVVNDTFDTQLISNSSVWTFGTRLRYAAITVNTTLQAGKLGFEKGLVTVEAWEKFVNDEVAKLPPSLSGGFQCTPDRGNTWHWLKVQKSLVFSAIQGIIIGIALALPILTIATQNFILGSLATLTIMCVTVTVVGIIPLAGWKLGVLESLNLSLVVGLAVDYVVHLAEGYHISKHTDRRGRLRDMLENVGISVLSGACTTLGASLFMLMAEILFFMQFGIFMFCTIGFSLIYSLVFFTVMLGICGPQNQTGSITPLITWVKNKLTGRNKYDVDCDVCEGHGFRAPVKNGE
ncbi:protein dispatched homolog 3-like [Patella vulgata]|uniref:protein dispatched homolog 3-like n=1 Tax=Patella vulgata TaxID=6465 RepID=UPI0021804EBB|nr:protein dispatched homolog 3-like [Patella vulgata]